MFLCMRIDMIITIQYTMTPTAAILQLTKEIIIVIIIETTVIIQCAYIYQDFQNQTQLIHPQFLFY